MKFSVLLFQKMNTLPPEIVQQIFDNVPKSSLPSCRLVCRSFNTFIFPILFSHVPHWLYYTTSHRAVISLVHDAFNRPAVMWSPWTAGPDGPVVDVWMGIVWRMLMKSNPPRLLVSNEEGGKELKKGQVRLTARDFAELRGRKEMSENRLRTGQNT